MNVLVRGKFLSLYLFQRISVSLLGTRTLAIFFGKCVQYGDSNSDPYRNIFPGIYIHRTFLADFHLFE